MDKMKIHLIQMKIDELLAVCDEHNNDPGELINILHAAQGIFGYLPREVQEIIAGRLHIPVSKVDRKSTRLNSSHPSRSRMPSSA